MIISATTVTAAAGSTGDFFYVNLTNTGPSSQNIAGFSIGISVTPAITLTGGNESTVSPYIFSGDSGDAVFSLPLVTSSPGQTLQASDFSNSGAGDTLASGATVGLAMITFNVAGGTSAGPITITISTTCGTPCSSLSDSLAANVPFTVTNGTINVTASAVPEPSTLLLALFVLPAIAFRRKIA